MKINLDNLTEEDKKKLIALKLGRDNFRDFCIVVDKKYQMNWHHEVIADKLQRAYERLKSGQSTKLIFELPPRHGKSEEISIKFPAWVLGKDPTLPIITVSYSQDLATVFGLSTKDLMESPNYHALFNSRLRKDVKAKANWMTTEGGKYFAVGIGGPITGKGFKVGIIDDPFKNKEEANSEVVRESIWAWYTSTFLTREETPSIMILIMTRWHDDDLVGRVLKQASEDGSIKEWDITCFPAISLDNNDYRERGEALWPDKYPIDFLERKRRDIGSYDFAALYQQDPVDEGNQEFKKNWFRYATMEYVKRLKTRCFVTIDPASAMRDKGLKMKNSSDNIGVTINYVDRENNWYFKSFKLRVNPKELINFMFDIYDETHCEEIGIEEGVYEQVIKPFLDDEKRKRNKFFTVKVLKHRQTEKNMRIRGLIPRYEAGTIYHIDKECIELEEELIRFPHAVHDDVCLDGDTLIKTIKGDIKIKDIKIGDKVITPTGIKEVLWSGETGFKEVIENIGIIGTKDHKIFNGNSFDNLDSIDYHNSISRFSLFNQIVWKYKRLLYSMENPILSWEGRESIISVNRIQTKEGRILKDFMLRFGNFIIKGKLEKALLFIIKTVILLITILVIWSANNLANIYRNILKKSGKIKSLGKVALRILIILENYLKSGINQKKEKNGIANTLKIQFQKNLLKFVLNAEKSINHIMSMENFVIEDANLDLTQENGERNTQIITKRKVYNITVKDDGVFYANGILVSNCDSAAYQNQIARPVEFEENQNHQEEIKAQDMEIY
jgi:hypothetical protein